MAIRKMEDRRKIEAAINEYYAEHAYPPTYRELMALTGVNSTSQVGRIVNELAAQGKVTTKPHASRCYAPMWGVRAVQEAAEVRDEAPDWHFKKRLPNRVFGLLAGYNMPGWDRKEDGQIYAVRLTGQRQFLAHAASRFDAMAKGQYHASVNDEWAIVAFQSKEDFHEFLGKYGGRPVERVGVRRAASR